MTKAADRAASGIAPGRSFKEIVADFEQKLRDLKKPTDFIVALIYCIPILAPIRLCLEAGTFMKLAQANRTLNIEELVPAVTDDANTASESDESQIEFMVRMLRAVTNIGLADECGVRTYCANELTLQLADPGFAAGFALLFDNAMGPRSTMTEFVSYHKAQSWSAPRTATDGPWQQARGAVGNSTFEYWSQRDPIQLTRLSSLMQRMQGEAAHWTDWFPDEALFRGREEETSPFFVDVGGGRGHDISALARQQKDQSLRFVLQDQPSVIDEGIRARESSGELLDPRITLSRHDFFQQQPIRGASIYFMHKIMHDWPDADCVDILSHLREAMAPRSRVFVNDVILPDTRVSLLHTAFDIDMLALHSGQERDESSWKKLTEKVGGLSVLKFWHPPQGEGEGIVEIGLRSSIEPVLDTSRGEVSQAGWASRKSGQVERLDK